MRGDGFHDQERAPDVDRSYVMWIEGFGKHTEAIIVGFYFAVVLGVILAAIFVH